MRTLKDLEADLATATTRNDLISIAARVNEDFLADKPRLLMDKDDWQAFTDLFVEKLKTTTE